MIVNYCVETGMVDECYNKKKQYKGMGKLDNRIIFFSLWKHFSRGGDNHNNKYYWKQTQYTTGGKQDGITLKAHVHGEKPNDIPNFFKKCVKRIIPNNFEIRRILVYKVQRAVNNKTNTAK